MEVGGEGIDSYEWHGSPSTIQIRIHEVERLMRHYEKESMYMQAEEQRQLLGRLKKRIQIHMSETEFNSGWSRVLSDIQEANGRRWEEFEAIWAQKLSEHEQRRKELLEAARQKHRNRQSELAQMMESIVRFPKWSTKLLDLRKRQYLLGKTQRYVEAEQIKRAAEQQETEEREQLLKSIEKDVKAKDRRLIERHERDTLVSMEKMELERQCLLEGKQQMAERLRWQCDRAAADVERRARTAIKHRAKIMNDAADPKAAHS